MNPFFQILLRYRLRSFINRIKNLDKWKRIKNTIFSIAIIVILTFLYAGFVRVLEYLSSVDIVGRLLIWKLSAMVFLINFCMIVISSLIISITTLFYSCDLKFLLSLPIPHLTVLFEKIILSVFYSSWSLVVIMIPYAFAMVKSLGLNLSFIFAFIFLIVPYAFLASYIGVFLSLFLMSRFPSPRTRDVVWFASSLSFAAVYVAIRFSKPERLIRPDAVGIIANYLSYLQAPTAPYLPSWWFTRSLIKFVNGDYLYFIVYSIGQYAVMLFATFLIMRYASSVYLIAFSGSQNTPSKKYFFKKSFEFFVSERFKRIKYLMMLFLKERKNFTRDVRYYSQTVLVFALSMVYVFSIKNIPVDGQEAKNIVAFINLIVSGFVVSALALRFVFTSLSIEDGNVWVLKTLPLKTSDIIYSKLLFYFIYILIFNLIIVGVSNYYLTTDILIFRFSVFVSVIMSFFISALAVSMGAFFPDFNIENIHHIESSYGGFLFMVSSVFYTVFTAVWFAYPLKIYFASRYLKNIQFDSFFFNSSILIFAVGSFIIAGLLLKKAVRSLEMIEV
ncbi:MAG: putative ABC transporter permease subunit [Elusimicrobiales bacterium]